MAQGERVPEGGLSRKERRKTKEQQKEAEHRRRRRKRLVKKSVTWGVVGLIVSVGVVWLGYSIATAKRLPPTSIADHVEQSPSGHILTTPMPIAIQKHMLEHADGGGRPGVIINYNCVKFRCADGLIDRLAGVVRAYPDFVYLAPYPEMDVKIAVTKLGKILTMDDPDLEKIRVFITE
jgi:hypothetical protein